MHYLCLVYVDRDLVRAATEQQLREIDRRSHAHNEELKASGHYVVSNALTEPETATTLKRRAGQVSMTDGPFAETKEHLGGFLMIEARDLNEALDIASTIPMAELGSIEVRATASF